MPDPIVPQPSTPTVRISSLMSPPCGVNALEWSRALVSHRRAGRLKLPSGVVPHDPPRMPHRSGRASWVIWDATLPEMANLGLFDGADGAIGFSRHSGARGAHALSTMRHGKPVGQKVLFRVRRNAGDTLRVLRRGVRRRGPV